MERPPRYPIKFGMASWAEEAFARVDALQVSVGEKSRAYFRVAETARTGYPQLELLKPLVEVQSFAEASNIQPIAPVIVDKE